MSGFGNVSLEDSNGTISTDIERSWSTITVAFEVINIVVLVTTLWILASVIIYGTKNGRWRKGRGGSSLNSGMIFVSCTVAVAMCIPRIIATELIYVLPRTVHTGDNCELLCDIASGTYAASAYCAYAFLCLRQRLIFGHPFVKERISRWANWMSRVGIVIITAAAIPLSLSFTLPTSFREASYGCILHGSRENDTGRLGKTEKFILLIMGFVLAQALLVFLSIYPAVSVKFGGSELEEVSGITLASPGSEDRNKKDDNHCNALSCFVWLKTLVQASKSVSPIQLTVRRTALSSVIIVVCDILAVLIAEFTLPKGTPTAVVRTIYNIASLLINFCLIWTFGNADQIISPFCPTIRTIKTYATIRRRRRPEETDRPTSVPE